MLTPRSRRTTEIKDAGVDGHRRQDGKGGRPGSRANLVLTGQGSWAWSPSQGWADVKLHTFGVLSLGRLRPVVEKAAYRLGGNK